MAKTIADIMADNQQLNPNLGRPTDQKAKLEKLLRAKSGKAVGAGTGPASSAIQETAATQQVAAQAKDIETQQMLQTQAVSQQEQQLEQQAQEMREADTEQAQIQKKEFNRQKDNILSDLKRNFQQMDMKERESKFQMAATLMRLDNQKYIHKLQTQGKRDRINSQAAWERKFAETQAKDAMILFRNNMLSADTLFQDDERFRTLMGEMDIKDALDALDEAAKQKGAEQMAGGMSQAISAGAQMYASYEGTPQTGLEKNQEMMTSAEGMSESEISALPQNDQTDIYDNTSITSNIGVTG